MPSLYAACRKRNTGPMKSRILMFEPEAFVYAVAGNYQALKYFCHDPQGANIPTATVSGVCQKISGGRDPFYVRLFGGFASFDKADIAGGIPYPAQNESAQWGHAIVGGGLR